MQVIDADEFGPEYARKVDGWTHMSEPLRDGWVIAVDSVRQANIVAIAYCLDDKPAVFDTERDCKMVIAVRQHDRNVQAIRNVLTGYMPKEKEHAE